jgi:ParB family chromosome partitioning protein
MNTTEFKEIRLSAIQPNPNNPRKTFDEKAVNELAESIKSKGVLQPIVVRPQGEGYEIVCGERRFRASKIAGIDRIPATVRNLTDEEALELMLMENFQRQDVHPMEEALGFEALTRISKLTVKDIAARIGKNWHYVADRLKLVKLIPDLQPYFFEGKLNLTTAVNVASLSEEVQREFLEEKKGETWLDDWNEDANYFKSMTANLNDAPFDINDAKLIEDRGSCVGCSFNTASSQLFPEFEGKPRCANTVCFNKKKATTLQITIENAQREEMPICIGYYLNEALKPFLKGVQYYTNHLFDELEEPVRSEYFSDTGFFFGDPDAGSEFESEEEWREEFNSNERRYQDADAEYKKALKKSNDYVRALYLNNDLTWKYTLVKINAEPAQATPSQTGVKAKEVLAQVESGEREPSLGELRVALQEAEEETESQVKIEDEKIFERVKQLFSDREDEEGNGHPNPVLLKFGELHENEKPAAVYVMLEELGFQEKEQFLADFTQEDISIFEDIFDGLELVDKVLEIVDFAAFRNAWIRWFINRKIQYRNGSRNENTGPGAKLFIKFAHHHFGGDVEAISDEITQKYAKKIDALQKQEAKLREKIAELEAKTKTKKKK